MVNKISCDAGLDVSGAQKLVSDTTIEVSFRRAAHSSPVVVYFLHLEVGSSLSGHHRHPFPI